jgi:hypothetical protein
MKIKLMFIPSLEENIYMKLISCHSSLIHLLAVSNMDNAKKCVMFSIALHLLQLKSNFQSSNSGLLKEEMIFLPTREIISLTSPMITTKMDVSGCGRFVLNSVGSKYPIPNSP